MSLGIQIYAAQQAQKASNNDLRSRSTIKLQELISEGDTKGLVGGLKGVWFDNTQVQNNDGSYNFPSVALDTRTGTPNQTAMVGFPGVENTVNVGVEIDQSPVVRSTTDGSPDAVRVMVSLPQGLYSLTSKGKFRGHRIGIAIETKLSSSPSGWTVAFAKTITGRTNSPYEEAYRIERPAGMGAWDIRIRRTTVKDTGTRVVDYIEFKNFTEIQDIKVTYPDIAYAGLYFDAESTAGAVPSRSFLWDGIKCYVPNNYTPTTYNSDGTINTYGHYTGVWNGLFKPELEWCDDPAWILYTLLTNPRWGFGTYIAGQTIDIYDFYRASVYNNTLIPSGKDDGSMEPRFRFNSVVTNQEDSFQLLQSVAASFRSVLYSNGSMIKLIQDRPQAPTRILNNTNVIDGIFSYSGPELSSKITAVSVNYIDELMGYRPATIREVASNDVLSQYGYNPTEISPVGVTSEGQARRIAKWMIDANLSMTENVTCKVSWNNALMEIGDVVEIADNFYANEQFSGVLSPLSGGTVNQINFDRPLTISAGTTIRFMDFNGQEYERVTSSNVTNSTTHNLVPATGSVNPNSLGAVPYVVLDVVVPRQFKVEHIKESTLGIYDVTLSEHDPNKYARIEEGIYVDPPLFTTITASNIGAPENVTATNESFVEQGIAHYRLRLDWDASTSPFIRNYRVKYRINNNIYLWSDFITHPEYVIEADELGIYEYTVYAYNINGVQSPPTDGWAELADVEVGVSDIDGVIDLRLIDGGETFTGPSFTLLWDEPDSTANSALMDYQVEIFEGEDTSAEPFHTFITPNTEILVTNLDIIRWADHPHRKMTVMVRVRDTLGRLGGPAYITIENPAPEAPVGVLGTAFFSLYQVEYSMPSVSDIVGTKIHHSTVSAFTPDKSNLVADTAVTGNHLITADEDTTYYYRVGFYDEWSEYDLNYSAQQSVTTQSTNVGIDPIAPTGLSASSTIIETAPGVQQAKVTLTWTRSTNASSYDLEILASSIGYAEYPQVSQPDSGLVSYSFITATAVPFQFRIRSRAANSVSVWSDVVNHTTVGDTTAPSTPTAFTISAGYQSAALSWTNPTANDLAAIIIYRRRTTAPTQSEAEIARYTVTPSGRGSYFDTDLTAGATYQYRIRAIDRSGNMSGYTSLVSVVPVEVDIPPGSIGPTEIADNAISIAKMANGLQPIEIVSSLPTSGNYVGRTVYLTTDGKLYRRTASAWTAAVPTTDLTGQITGVQITNNAVTAAKIAANTITASEINATSIRSAVLIANSITTGMIQAGAITASEIAAGAITASKMAIATTENLIPDATFSNNGGEWNPLGSTNNVTQYSSAAMGIGVQITKTASTANAQLAQPGYSSTTTIPPNAIKVEAGAEYRVKGTLWTNISGGTKGLSARYWTNTGTSGTTTVSSVAAGNTGTYSLDRVWTIPATYVAVQFFLNAGSGTGTGTTRITNLSVTRMAGGELIVDGAITAGKIASNTITSNEINASSIRSAVLVANSITTNMIAANQVTAAKIAGNTITANEIAANTITSGQINANSIRTAILTANSIKTNMIESGAVTADKISTYNLTASNASIANGLIVNAMIANGTIENAKIANGTITNAKIGGDIWSSNWANNSTGWRIYQNGNFQLNGNTGSGRTVMNGSVIQMYDSGNNLRIKIGIS